MADNASTLLLKASAIYFAGAAFLHTLLSIKRLFPYFGTRGNEFQPFVFKNITLQLSGYFVINSIIIWRWAERGILDKYDRATMVILVAMNTIGGLAFIQRGYWRPPPVGLLLGTSAMIVASQVLRKQKE